jgi:hypothetical protein
MAVYTSRSLIETHCDSVATPDDMLDAAGLHSWLLLVFLVLSRHFRCVDLSSSLKDLDSRSWMRRREACCVMLCWEVTKSE